MSDLNVSFILPSLSASMPVTLPDIVTRLTPSILISFAISDASRAILLHDALTTNPLASLSDTSYEYLPARLTE